MIKVREESNAVLDSYTDEQFRDVAVIVVRGNIHFDEQFFDVIEEKLPIGAEIIWLSLPEGSDLDMLNEADMNRLGWYRG